VVEGVPKTWCFRGVRTKFWCFLHHLLWASALLLLLLLMLLLLPRLAFYDGYGLGSGQIGV